MSFATPTPPENNIEKKKRYSSCHESQSEALKKAKTIVCRKGAALEVDSSENDSESGSEESVVVLSSAERKRSSKALDTENRIKKEGLVVEVMLVTMPIRGQNPVYSTSNLWVTVSVMPCEESENAHEESSDSDVEDLSHRWSLMVFQVEVVAAVSRAGSRLPAGASPGLSPSSYTALLFQS